MTTPMRYALTLALAAALLGAPGCGRDPSGDSLPGPEAESDSSSTQAFCAAVQALDETDGTTDADVVIAAVDDLRRAAPMEIRDDVNTGLDALLLLNYPEHAVPSAELPTIEERTAAGARVAAYASEHC